MYKNPEDIPINNCINSGILKYILELISEKYDFYPELQYEALWMLSNVAIADLASLEKGFGRPVTTVLNMVTRFLNKKFDFRIFEHILWFIGNITSNKYEIGIKNFMIQNGVYRQIIDVVAEIYQKIVMKNSYENNSKNQHKKFILKTTVWVITNLLESDKDYDESLVKNLYQPAVALIMRLIDLEFDWIMTLEGHRAIHSF